MSCTRATTPERADDRCRRRRTPRRSHSWPARRRLPWLRFGRDRSGLDRSRLFMHWLEDDLPPDRTDLTRPDRHRAVRRRERHLGRLARCVLQGDQPLNPRHRHHPLNAGVSMSVPHLAPRGKSQDNTNPPVGAMNPRSPEEPVGDSADGEPAPGLPVASSTPRIWASHPASRRSNRARRKPPHTSRPPGHSPCHRVTCVARDAPAPARPVIG